ncbi:MAG: fibronectin type III domain-containing protein, partial [Terriglobales bacterium]
TPATEADLAGYNVFRRGQAAADWVKINADLVTTPTYRDEKTAPGHHYTYSVTAVDVRGNESARSEPATELAP